MLAIRLSLSPTCIVMDVLSRDTPSGAIFASSAQLAITRAAAAPIRVRINRLPINCFLIMVLLIVPFSKNKCIIDYQLNSAINNRVVNLIDMLRYKNIITPINIK